MNNLALMYGYGRGVSTNYIKAIELYEKAVDLGNPTAMNNLALMYENGQGVPVDYQKAIKLYERAVDVGHLKAMNNLAFMNERGLGMEKNLNRALDLYLQGKYIKSAKNLINHCSDLKEKMNLFKICLKHDFYFEYSRMYVVFLREKWFFDVVYGFFPHQKHPLYNRHMDALIARYM